jgi:uncharacterized phage protein (TIGR01671 family)
MMREIKFRAWDKTTQKNWNIDKWHFEDEYLDLIEPGVSICNPRIERIWRKQEDVEIMQFTGLKDKNGREIYEGDVLDCINGDIKTSDKSFYSGRCLGQVGFVGASFIVWPRPVVDGRRMHYGCEVLSDGLTKYTWENEIAAGESTVIGNIYENPELLEADIQ